MRTKGWRNAMLTASLPSAVTIVAMSIPASALRADGKFFVRDQVPAGEPFQRAVIIHAGSQEFLLVQPQLVGAAVDFAWVLPVPSTPSVGWIKAEDANKVFEMLSVASGARAKHWARYFFMGLFIAGSILALLPWPRWNASTKGLLYLVFFCLLVLLALPQLMVARGRSAEGVEVLEAGKVGIYDFQTVRPRSPDSMQAWLATNGFKVGPDDGPVLRSYGERGWCFVAARISRKETGVNAGMIDALALSFPSPEPIYPFALTAAGGTETDVQLFAFADHCLNHPGLSTSFAGPSGDAFTLHALEDVKMLLTLEEEHLVSSLPVLPQTPAFLTKLRGRLSNGVVAGDVFLRRAPDDAPYREEVWRW
jgi:uncharacterized protein DUF2330